MSDAQMVPLPGVPGGIGRRLAALIVDWLVATAVAMLLVGSAGYASNEVALTTLGAFFVEVTLLTWLSSASFGQRILGLRVVRVDGSSLGLARVALRTLLLCLVIPAVVIDRFGRGLHDRAAGSIVIRRT